LTNLLFTVLAFSVIVLFVEIIAAKWKGKGEENEEDSEPIAINVHIETINKNGAQMKSLNDVSFSKYLQIRQLIDDSIC
jgi:hypothetical protein